MTYMLEARNLVKDFGTALAVNGVSLGVSKGEVLGFLGPNGAGKTTTMKILTGFLTPTSGEALICGHNVESDAIEAKSRVGYLPEGAPAYGEMTVRQFLNFIADVRGLEGDIRASALTSVIDSINLEGVLDQTIDTLSKGFQRRVGLAQAILHNPEVLILDEPTDGLDPNQKHEVRRLIRQMAPEKAIIISTHSLEEVEAVCTRAVIIDRGKIVADGTPDELKARSRYRNGLHLLISGAGQEEAVQALKQVAGVTDVEISTREDGKLAMTAFAAKGTSILDGARKAIGEAGWTIEELSVDSGRLDDVFRKLTTSDAEEVAS